MYVYCFSQYDGLRPTTNPISDMRLCEGLAAEGYAVSLLAPYRLRLRRNNANRKELREAYGLKAPVTIRRLPTPLVEQLPPAVAVPILVAFVALAYLIISLRRRRELAISVVLSRDANCLVPVIALHRLIRWPRPTIIIWLHDLPPNKWQYRFVLSGVDGALATNSAIITDLRDAYGFRKPTGLSLNPIPAEYLSTQPDQETARRSLGLSTRAPLAVYTGKLGFGLREIDYILEAAKLLPAVTFVLTGGKPHVVAHFRRTCEGEGLTNVIFTGFLFKVEQVRAYQRAADVVISYYSSYDHVTDHNYPQKLTEYMASGAPIVSPAFRATTDILRPDNAILVEPEDPAVLAAAIEQALAEGGRGHPAAARALEDARNLTVEHRAQEVRSFLERVHADR
jgi:glycosyltransferase involved in cell wall biosynthesis